MLPPGKVGTAEAGAVEEAVGAVEEAVESGDKSLESSICSASGCSELPWVVGTVVDPRDDVRGAGVLLVVVVVARGGPSSTVVVMI